MQLFALAEDFGLRGLVFGPLADFGRLFCETAGELLFRFRFVGLGFVDLDAARRGSWQVACFAPMLSTVNIIARLELVVFDCFWV